VHNEIASIEFPMVVKPADVDVVLAEQGADAVGLKFPPLDELLKAKELFGKPFSLHVHVAQLNLDEKQKEAQGQLDVLLRKRDKYGATASFVARAAALASRAGSPLVSEAILRDAAAATAPRLLRRKLVDSLLSRRALNEAEALLESPALADDAQSLLRLAALRIHSNQIAAAQELVNRAVQVEPTDFNVRMFEGGLHILHLRLDDALLSFRIAQEERPNSSVLHANIGIAYALSRRNRLALGALRKAAAFDPLNANAVALLADVATREGRSDLAVPALALFLEHEGTDWRMWSRYAQVLHQAKRWPEAKQALLKQSTMRTSPALFNNLGCVSHEMQETQKAREYFAKAMAEDARRSRSYFLAARNLATMTGESRDWVSLLSFTERVLKEDSADMCVSDVQLCDLHIGRLISMSEVGDRHAALELARASFYRNDAAPDLKAAGLGIILNLHSLSDNELIRGRGAEIAIANLDFMDRTKGVSARRMSALVNSVVFALIEGGRLDVARKALPHLSRDVHNMPYATATLGLYRWRSGHEDEGVRLYEEAIALAQSARDKTIIRQKLNLEHGRALLERGDQRAALKFLNRCQEAEGSWQLKSIAQTLMAGLSNQPRSS
jgi:tetratricopeptide (TPR) repeat protein